MSCRVSEAFKSNSGQHLKSFDRKIKSNKRNRESSSSSFFDQFLFPSIQNSNFDPFLFQFHLAHVPSFFLIPALHPLRMLPLLSHTYARTHAHAHTHTHTRTTSPSLNGAHSVSLSLSRRNHINSHPYAEVAFSDGLHQQLSLSPIHTHAISISLSLPLTHTFQCSTYHDKTAKAKKRKRTSGPPSPHSTTGHRTIRNESNELIDSYVTKKIR